MIVSIPVDISSPTCSEPSEVRTLDDMIDDYGEDHWFKKGLDLRNDDEGKIYQYSLDKNIHVTPFKSRTHKVDDIVIKDGHHHIITDVNVKAGKKTPYQPEEYTDNETSINNWKTWKGRYFKIGKSSIRAWTVGDRVYYLYVAGHPCSGMAWKAWDRTTNGCYNTTTQCIRPYVSYSFKEAKDIVGNIRFWAGGGSIREDTLVINSAVSRGGVWYLRTHIKYKIKYHTTSASTSYVTKRIYSPKEINGFRYNRMTNCMAAFDDKNYTKGKFSPSSGYVDFSYITTGWTDTFAIGRVYAESVSVTARNENGTIVFSVTDYPIQNEIADTNIGQDSNVILYSDKVLPPKSKITVRIKAGEVSVGRILAGRKLTLGFTNTIFENGFKDFSPKEQDQWGNVMYKNGVRVYIHNGTVDLPLKDYDSLNRAFMHIGGQEMIINSSDSINNTPPNSLTVFQATMFIGRFINFKQKTRNVGDLMDNVASFVFACEESV